MVGFPTTIETELAGGVVGEQFRDGPLRARELMLASTSAANNVIGRWFTEPTATPGTAQAGGTGAIAGLLSNAKEYVNNGNTTDGTFGSNITLPNGAMADFVSMGIMNVNFPEGFTIGQPVCYDTATGIIHAGAPGAGQAVVPNATVVEFSSTVAGGGVVQFTN